MLMRTGHMGDSLAVRAGQRLAAIGLLHAALAGAWAQSATTAAAPRDDDGEDRYTVILADRVITVSGKEIDNGVIVVSNGTITNVGKSIDYPRNAHVIDARDRVVMPGLIDPHSRFGLPRYNRGGVNGQAGAADEFFFVEGQFDDLLDAGYTAVALVPTGTGIPGRAMVVRTGGPIERRTLVAPSYLEVSRDKALFRGALEKAKQEIEKVEKARKEWEEKQKAESKPADTRPATAPASQPPPVTQPPGGTQPATAPATTQATQPAFKPPPIDPAHQPLVDLIEKKEGLFALIELQNASDYLHFRQVLRKFDIAHAFLVRNGLQSDFFRVVNDMGEHKPRVVVMPQISRLPLSAERLSVPADMSRVGCEVSLTPLNDSAGEYRRVLSRAADLVRDGWSREEAIKSLTLHPARLLRIESRFGSIEKGKEADLILLDGDPLSGMARVRGVIVGGALIHEVANEQ